MNHVIILCAKYLVVFVILSLVIAWLKGNKNTKLRFVIAFILAGATAMLALTIGLGVTRVLAKVDSPLANAGGWLLGIVGAIAGYYLLQRLFNNHHLRSIVQ